MTFDEAVCMPVRSHLRRPVRLPVTSGRWDFGLDGGSPLLSLTVDSTDLAANLQTNRAATPWFLMCFAYWYAQVERIEPKLRLVVEGDAPSRGRELRHYRRAWIGLEAMEHALGDRLEVIGGPEERWPVHPVINAPTVERGHGVGGGGREHQVEVELTGNPAHAQRFSELVAPITGFYRQLPLGVFDGVVSGHARWTPGSAAQADLWAVSPDEGTFHLFELKASTNRQVGVLPELMSYAWILHKVRQGEIEGGGAGADAARDASRMVAWILAPEVHPLVLARGRSPMEWLAEGLRDVLELGMVFYDDPAGSRGLAGWKPEILRFQGDPGA